MTHPPPSKEKCGWDFYCCGFLTVGDVETSWLQTQYPLASKGTHVCPFHGGLVVFPAALRKDSQPTLKGGIHGCP